MTRRDCKYFGHGYKWSRYIECERWFMHVLRWRFSRKGCNKKHCGAYERGGED